MLLLRNIYIFVDINFCESPSLDHVFSLKILLQKI